MHDAGICYNGAENLKKQEIIETAIDLFAEYGISNVSVAKIAKAISSSSGKVYHYFKDGKADMITEMLQIFENHISDYAPNEIDWKDVGADTDTILSRLFFEFLAKDKLLMRKIVRIIMSEMYFNPQIAQHTVDSFITGREKLLADCLSFLADKGKIPPLDAESAARCLNRLIVVYAIEDALNYPYVQAKAKLDEQTKKMICDCKHIIRFMIKKEGLDSRHKRGG